MDPAWFDRKILTVLDCARKETLEGFTHADDGS
ncbi:MAG: hypothetical protein ACJAWP_001600 [Porticoccus sp.]|jgi:hypothetical protein